MSAFPGSERDTEVPPAAVTPLHGSEITRILGRGHPTKARGRAGRRRVQPHHPPRVLGSSPEGLAGRGWVGWGFGLLGFGFFVLLVPHLLAASPGAGSLCRAGLQAPEGGGDAGGYLTPVPTMFKVP